MQGNLKFRIFFLYKKAQSIICLLRKMSGISFSRESTRFCERKMVEQLRRARLLRKAIMQFSGAWQFRVYDTKRRSLGLRNATPRKLDGTSARYANHPRREDHLSDDGRNRDLRCCNYRE